MNLRLITKNHAAYPEIGFPQKIDFKVVWPRNGNAAGVGVKDESITEISLYPFGSKLYVPSPLSCVGKIQTYKLFFDCEISIRKRPCFSSALG